jgi:hypothetical protein
VLPNVVRGAKSLGPDVMYMGETLVTAQRRARNNGCDGACRCYERRRLVLRSAHSGQTVRVAWTIDVRSQLTYGSGVRRPPERRYPLRFVAAVAAAWCNVRHRHPGDGPYVALEAPRRRSSRT